MSEPSPATIDYRRASFLKSAPTLRECPADAGAEVAFAGRSNAGKSSAINALTNNRKLARTSKTPGRTQLLNFFALDDTRRLVDLPGYGFAKVPVAVKLEWQRHLEAYLSERVSLRGLVLMMDVRHPLQPFDMQLLEWAERSAMPTHVLLTKADKLNFGTAKSALLGVQKTLQARKALIATAQLFSSLNNLGLEQLQRHLDGWLQIAAPELEINAEQNHPEP